MGRDSPDFHEAHDERAQVDGIAVGQRRRHDLLAVDPCAVEAAAVEQPGLIAAAGDRHVVAGDAAIVDADLCGQTAAGRRTSVGLCHPPAATGVVVETPEMIAMR